MEFYWCFAAIISPLAAITRPCPLSLPSAVPEFHYPISFIWFQVQLRVSGQRISFFLCLGLSDVFFAYHNNKRQPKSVSIWKICLFYFQKWFRYFLLRGRSANRFSLCFRNIGIKIFRFGRNEQIKKETVFNDHHNCIDINLCDIASNMDFICRWVFFKGTTLPYCSRRSFRNQFLINIMG